MFDWTEKKKKTWLERFTEQPHQLFFGFAIIWSILIMFLSQFIFISGSGDFSQIHSFGIIYGVFANAFLGFLFTVIPRYTQSILIKSKKYITIFIVYQIAIFAFLFINHDIGKFLVSIALISSSVIFAQTIKQGRNKTQNESWWLTFLVLIGGFLPILEFFAGINLAIFSLWLFVFPLVYVVTQRMVPAFFSVYFKENVTEKPIWNLPIYVSLFFVIGIFWENKTIVSIFSFVLFGAICYFAYNAKIFRKAIPILNILSIAVAWLVVGIFTIFVESIFQIENLKLGLHILVLGFVLTLLIGFGTRVILGHSGRKLETDKVTIIIFIITQIVIITRIATSLYFVIDTNWVGFIHFAFLLWAILFIIWGLKYGAILFRTKE